MVKCIHGNVYPSECCRLRRDHFAAAALMGLLTAPDPSFCHEDSGEPAETMSENYALCARYVVGYVDALLAELDKPQE